MVRFPLAENHQMLFRKRECHKHSRIHENPQINPKNTGSRKKSVKKPNPCPPLNPCLIFCPSPQAYGHYIITDIIIPCCRCVPSLRQGHKSKKETRITPRSTDWSFTDNFLIIFHQWYLDSDLDLAGFASARALPFGVWYGDVIDRMLSYAFRKRECPSTHKSTKILNISLK